ncbi:hypothetical protein IJ556_03075, partial [bacterium]|nr:hypothetical protein [bacterium]
GYSMYTTQKVVVPNSKSGCYGEYAHSEVSGNNYITYFDKDGNKISKDDFYAMEGLEPETEYYIDKNGNINEHTVAGGMMAFAKGFFEAIGIVAVAPLALLSSCTDGNTYIDVDQSVDIKVTLANKFDEQIVVDAINNASKTIVETMMALFNRFGDDLKNNLQPLLAAILANGGKLDDIIALLNKMNQTLEKNTAHLQDIKDIENAILIALKKLGTDTQKYFMAILDAINANGDKIGDLKALLQVIANLVKEGNEQQIDATEKILAALAKLDFHVVEGADKILQAVLQGNMKLDDVLKLLNIINNNVVKGNKQQEEAAEKLLQAVVNNGLKLDNIAKILQDIKAITDKGFTGVNTLLNAILEKLGKMDNNNAANFQAVINAIKNINISGGGTVDLSTVEALLRQLVEIAKANGGKLDNIIEQNQMVIGLLQTMKSNLDNNLAKILTKMDQLDANQKTIIEYLKKLSAKADTIIAQLNNGSNCNVDFDALMAKLQEILEAIKNHKVEVTVDGKITVECHCGGGSTVHEGELDLSGIIG